MTHLFESSPADDDADDTQTGAPVADDAYELADRAVERAFTGWSRFDYLQSCEMTGIFDLPGHPASPTGPWIALYALALDDEGLAAWASSVDADEPSDEAYFHDLFEGWGDCEEIGAYITQIAHQGTEDGLRRYNVWVCFRALPEDR